MKMTQGSILETKLFSRLTQIHKCTQKNGYSIANEYMSMIYKIENEVKPILNKVQLLFGQYTDHTIAHSARVCEHIYELIKDKIELFTATEIALMIYSAIFHDIGMSIEQHEKEAILKGEDALCADVDIGNVLKNITNNNENEAVKYVVRELHGILAGRKIDAIINTPASQISFMIPGSQKDLVQYVKDLSLSHQVGLNDIKKKFTSSRNKGIVVLGVEEINATFLAILLRLADYMDINSDRASIYTYSMQRVFLEERSKNHWIQNFGVTNDKKVELLGGCEGSNCKNKRYRLFLHVDMEEAYNKAKATDRNFSDIDSNELDQVQRQIIQYKSDMQKELEACLDFLENTSYADKYQLNFDKEVKLTFKDERRNPNHKIEMEYKTIVNLLLGEKVYGERRIGLRELLQNSIDACKNYIAHAKKEQVHIYTPFIRIKYSKTKNTINIADNGIGMGRDIIDKYFLRIGKSYYASAAYRASPNMFKNTGYYGIGFFAAFMLSNDVEVITRRIFSTGAETFKIRLNTETEYATIQQLDHCEFEHGTSVQLKADQFFKNFNTAHDESHNGLYDIKMYIAHNFLSDIGAKHFQIVVSDEDKGIEENCEILDLTQNVPTAKGTQKVYDLSPYLNQVKALLEVEQEQEFSWYEYDADQKTFLLSNPSQLYGNSEVTYLKFKTCDNKYVYLFVPFKYAQDPFEHDGFDRERCFSHSDEIIWGECSLRSFVTTNSLLIDLHKEVFAVIGKFKLESSDGNVYYFKENAWIETSDFDPITASTVNGRNKRDKIYIRNILIPKFHLEIERLLCGKNNLLIHEINKLVANIMLDGVVPELDRNDVNSNVKTSFSKAIETAIIDCFSKQSAIFTNDNNVLKYACCDVANEFIRIEQNA